jgi:hypothetical protein
MLVQEELFREYIDLAAAIPTFGINLYNVFDGEFEKGGVKRRLGIGEDGIMLTRRAEKVRALAPRLPLPPISYASSELPSHRERTTSIRGLAWAAGSRPATPSFK